MPREFHFVVYQAVHFFNSCVVELRFFERVLYFPREIHGIFNTLRGVASLLFANMVD